MSRIVLKIWQVHAIGAGVCLVLSVGAYFGIGKPILQKHATLTATRAQWDVFRRRSAELEGQRRSLMNQLRQTHEELDDSRVRLQSPELLNTRIAEITDLAFDCNLVLHETSSGQLTRRGLYDTIEISLAGSGSYPSAASFLHRLRQEMPDTGIVSMTLTGNPRTPRAAAQYQLDVVWYTAPIVASVGE